MRILSLDIGFRKTGIAISSFDQAIISPLPKLCLDKFNGKIFFDNLKKNILPFWEEINEVIIGGGFDNEYENKISKFIEEVLRVFRSWTTWKIVLVSEINSSIDSKEFLKRANYPKSKRKELSDSYAALLLLKDYFDSLNREVMVSF